MLYLDFAGISKLWKQRHIGLSKGSVPFSLLDMKLSIRNSTFYSLHNFFKGIFREKKLCNGAKVKKVFFHISYIGMKGISADLERIRWNSSAEGITHTHGKFYGPDTIPPQWLSLKYEGTACVCTLSLWVQVSFAVGISIKQHILWGCFHPSLA